MATKEWSLPDLKVLFVRKEGIVGLTQAAVTRLPLSMGACFDRGSFMLRTMAGLFVRAPGRKQWWGEDQPLSYTFQFRF